VAICANDSTLLDAGSGHTNYLWNTGDTTQTIYADTAGTYSVTVGNGTSVSNSNSLSFDGNSLVEVPDNPYLDLLTNNFTLDASVYLNAYPTGAHGRILHRSEGFGANPNKYCLSIEPTTNKAEFHITGIGELESQIALNLNQWYKVTAIYNGSEMKIYIDGILSNSIAASGSMQVDEYPLYIGGSGWNGGNSYLNGKIDNPTVWNKALTQSEIQYYMSSPPTGNEVGLVGYWNFNEGSGTTVTDLSGNGNNGTINGATWSTDAPAQYANNCTQLMIL